MSEKRTLKKKDKDNFVLVIEDKENKYIQEKGYSRKELKENYEGLKTNMSQISHALMTNKKDLNKIGGVPEFNKEEKKIKEVILKMESEKKANELVKLISNLEKQQKDFKKWIKEIEVAVPELTR